MLESDETYDESSPVPESMMQEKQTEVAVEAQPSASDADESNDNEAREAGVEGEPNSDGASEEAIPKWKLLWMLAAQKVREGADKINENETVQKIKHDLGENVDKFNNNETVIRIKTDVNEKVIAPVAEVAAPIWEKTVAVAAPAWESTKETVVSTSSSVYQSSKEFTESAAARAAPVWESTKETVAEKAKATNATIQEYTASTQEKLAPTMRRASEGAASLWAQTIAAASSAAETASTKFNDTVSELVGEEDASK